MALNDGIAPEQIDDSFTACMCHFPIIETLYNFFFFLTFLRIRSSAFLTLNSFCNIHEILIEKGDARAGKVLFRGLHVLRTSELSPVTVD